MIVSLKMARYILEDIKMFGKKSLLVAMFLMIQAGVVFAQYRGGDGSKGNPYQIGDLNDWRELMTEPNDWGRYFVLTADINLAGVHVTPIGNNSRKFYGIFDGNNHIISNVSIVRPSDSDVGLFGYVGHGKIINLGVKDVNIIGSNYVGGLVGNNSGATINNCYTTGSVSDSKTSSHRTYAGGLIGYNMLTGSTQSIYNCFSTCSVSCSSDGANAGGLIGYNYSRVSHCYATGDVYSASEHVDIGGLIGFNYGGGYIIDACYATGSVSAPFSLVGNIGGLIGNCSGHVSNCYARGPVSANAGYIGGLTGRADYISNCYSTGLVTGYSTNYVRGLTVVSNNENVVDSFWDIETSGQTKSSGGTGLTSAEMKTISSFLPNWKFANQNRTTSFPWVMREGDYPILALQLYKPVALPDLRGMTVSQASSILNDLQIPQGKSYLAYDSTIQPGLIARTIPDVPYNYPYPYPMYVYQGLTKVHMVIAKNYKFSGGDGSVTNPYKISDIDNLQELTVTSDLSKNFIMTADINCLDDPFTHVGNARADNGTFAGVFDGNDHIISNLIIDMIDQWHHFDQIYGGLFPLSNGQIKNLHIENINLKISGSLDTSATIGGLIGKNYGIITNCSVTGKAYVFLDFLPRYSSFDIGGLAGGNTGIISNCFASVSIDASTDSSGSFGGLVGRNNGTISSSHAAGSIKLSENSSYCAVGGLAGGNAATINNSYATGAVSSFSNKGASIAGLIGNNSGGTINNCYATGPVFSSNSTPKGLICDNVYGVVTSSFWNKETTGCSTSYSGTGLTEQQMKSLSTFTTENWDFINIWDIGEGQTYPYLRKYSAADINQDSMVDYFDLAQMANNWLGNL